MPEITFTVNGASVTIDAENDDELLYLLRDRVGIFGPKYGCGVGVCGACTIFKDGELARPCIVPMAEVGGAELTTIEGLAVDDVLHPVQRAWIDEDVSQCGFCQAGQIMTAVKLLEANPAPSDADIDEAMSDNVCRCGTYYRIRQAIKRAAGMGPPPEKTGRLAGSTRIGTAIRISEEMFGAGEAASVVIARADNFPDALAGAPLAASLGAPMLLTPTTELDGDVLAEIDRVLAPGGEVYVLGGTTAVGAAVVAALEVAGVGVTRVAGSGRRETAVEIAGLVTDPTAIFVATGDDFADALVAGAAAARVGGVVLLTGPDGLEASSQAFIDANADVDLYVIGQPAADAAGDIGGTVISGEDRFVTAVNVAEAFGDDLVGVALASGERFPDALVGAVHAASAGVALLLVAERSLPVGVSDYIRTKSGLSELFVYGGAAAIAENVLVDARAALDA